MEKTALTVGGFTQPSVARTIIEQTTGAERGFSQRFLWIFPKPTFAKFASLEPVSDEISATIGKCGYSLHKNDLQRLYCIL